MLQAPAISECTRDFISGKTATHLLPKIIHLYPLFLSYLLRGVTKCESVCLFLLALVMRTSTGRYITLIVGLLVAISAILSQTLSFDLPSGDERDTVVVVAGQENDERQGEDSFARLSPTSLPAPTLISFNQEAICLFEILFTDDDSSSPSFESAARPLTEFFSVLLGAVISPNAP